MGLQRIRHSRATFTSCEKQRPLVLFNPPGPSCTFARTAIMRRASRTLFLGLPQPECHPSSWEFSPCQTEMESTCSKEIFPGGPGGEESTCNAGDPAVIPAWGRSLGEQNGCPSSILTWRIPCSEMLEGYRSRGRRESGPTELLTLSHSRDEGGDLNAPCFVWWRE